MEGDQSLRGYMLHLAGIACLGAVACGPEQIASDGGETTAATGYPLESGTDASPEETETGETETGEPETGEPVPECDYPGTLCGELSVCQCNCDYLPDCCFCGTVPCTNDSHCERGEGCTLIGASNYACLPDYCESSISSLELYGEDDPARAAGKVCIGGLIVRETALTDLATFTELRYVHGSLTISDNPMLTSVQGLAGIEAIGEGGEIINNPMLPTADVEALLAQIPGGDAVLVCGNLGGEPC